LGEGARVKNEEKEESEGERGEESTAGQSITDVKWNSVCIVCKFSVCDAI